MTISITPTLPLVRIIYDSDNTDGWIAKLVSSNPELAGKIAFIANLDSIIQDLMPGQLWNVIPIEQQATYWKVQLTQRYQPIT